MAFPVRGPTASPPRLSRPASLAATGASRLPAWPLPAGSLRCSRGGPCSARPALAPRPAHARHCDAKALPALRAQHHTRATTDSQHTGSPAPFPSLSLSSPTSSHPSSPAVSPSLWQSILFTVAAAAPLLAAHVMLSAPALAADVMMSVAEGAELEPLGYSPASYYSSLGLFVISIPGLWSLIKRATKSKIVRRTFEVPGPAATAATGGKSLAQLAGEVTSLLNRSNYRLAESDRKDVALFEGDIVPSRSQAAFLVFCTALSLASVALVLSITNPDVGEWWYSIVGLSPLAGVYYWRKAQRKEQIQVKIVISDDEKTADITMQGDDEEIERVRRELNLMEKGLDYIKGIFEA